MPTTIAINHDLLRSWRVTAGLSRERVAADVGTGASWLAIIESGTPGRVPSLDLIIRLARYFGHEPGELLNAPADQ